MANSTNRNPIRIETGGVDSSKVNKNIKIQAIYWQGMSNADTCVIRNYEGTNVIWESTAGVDNDERKISFPKGLPVVGIDVVMLGSGVVYIYESPE